MSCLIRQDEFFLDNASIFLSGSLKGKIEALSKHTRQATGLTKQLLTTHCSLLTGTNHSAEYNPKPQSVFVGQCFQAA